MVNETKSKIMKIGKKGEENGVNINLNERRMEEVETILVHNESLCFCD